MMDQQIVTAIERGCQEIASAVESAEPGSLGTDIGGALERGMDGIAQAIEGGLTQIAQAIERAGDR
jgi:hypothetical protein